MTDTVTALPGCGFCGTRDPIGDLRPVRICQPDGTMGDRAICYGCLVAVGVTDNQLREELLRAGARIAGQIMREDLRLMMRGGPAWPSA